MAAFEIGVLVVVDRLAGAPGGGRPIPGEGPRAIVECAVLVEQLGFESLWLAGSRREAWASAVLLAAVAMRTGRLRLGAALPVREGLDPLRVAEDFATLDGISGGRIELAASAGGSGSEASERLREQVELLRRLWTGREVSWSGRFRTPLERVTVEPRPVQEPHPPLWIEGGGSPPCAADLAGELGLPLLLLESSADRGPLADRYRERAARAGHAARVGAVALASGGSPAALAEGILADRERLGLDLQLLRVELGGLPEPALRAALERLGAELLPLLQGA